MYDTYVPVPPLRCPACGAELRDWQGKDGPCGLMVWRQGVAAPVDQAIHGDSRLDPGDLSRKRLPDAFGIYTDCCDSRFLVEAIGRCAGGVWTACEVVTTETAKQQKHERREDFAARLRWLRGEER